MCTFQNLEPGYFFFPNKKKWASLLVSCTIIGIVLVSCNFILSYIVHHVKTNFFVREVARYQHDTNNKLAQKK